MKIAYVMFRFPIQDVRMPRHAVMGKRTEFRADETLSIDLEGQHYLLTSVSTVNEGAQQFLVPAGNALWSEILQDVEEGWEKAVKRGPGRPRKVA